MGSRNLDRIPIADRRRGCETVAEMHAQGWRVRSKCGRCGLEMAVDLVVIARISGAGVSLWDRTAACRRIGCSGRVKFLARAPGTGWYEPLISPGPEFDPRPPAWQRNYGPG